MEKVVKDKLWTPSFCVVVAGNFLLFFAFYLLLPVLPMYLSEAFAASRSTAGFILSSYTITALMIRPFAGYMVDTFPRKPLLLICYFVFLLFFGGYLLAGTLLLFAIIRAGHGVAFGLLTVSNSTVAIDVMPSSRRGEGIGYYGVSNNLAMAVGPTLSLYIHDAYANFDYIFLLSMVSATIGLIAVSTIKMPYRRDPVPEKPPISLDRFLLLRGMPEAVTLIFYSFSYGVLSTYLAVYGKEELGIESGAGFFFILLAIGLILSRLASGQWLNRGFVTRNIFVGMLLSLLGYLIFVGVRNEWGYYGAAVMLGLGYGCICPAYQTMFINLAPNNQRGTANSTYLTAWDLGVGLGVLIGGQIADLTNYATVYATACVLCTIGYLLFRFKTAAHFEKYKLR